MTKKPVIKLNMRRTQRVSTYIKQAVIIGSLLFTARFCAGATLDGTEFNPAVYKSTDIKYRDPSASKPFFASEVLKAARSYLVLGYLPEAAMRYKDLSGGGDTWEAAEPEYAYTLALQGFYEPAMLNLDDARMKDPGNPEPFYYAAQAFAFAGYGDVADNLMKTAAGGDNFYSGLAGSGTVLKKSIGAVSYTDVDNDLRSELGYPGKKGVFVANVLPGKLNTGLKPRDIIISAAGLETLDSKSLDGIIKSSQAGSRLELVVWRNRAKNTLYARISSSNDLSSLPSPKGSAAAPDEGAKEKLGRALSLLADKKYFTSILVYRELIEKYPDWFIPYLGYTLALEKAGAFDCAKKASEQGASASGNNKDAAAQLKNRSKQLGAMTTGEKAGWRPAQTEESFRDLPQSFYLGFGGGQMMFGSGGFKLILNTRVGLLTNQGIDLSASLGLDTSSGLDLGITGTQRFYYSREYSFNTGAAFGISTSGPAVSIGVMGGGSWYFERNNSLDLMVTLRAYLGGSTPAGALIYIGTTRYL